MSFQPPSHWNDIRGFLAGEEAAALHGAALDTAHLGPALEIGSYCGKSTVCIGLACRERGQVLFALDHHRGSEEHQPGELFHDPALYDSEAGEFDSFGDFRRNVTRAGLDDTVVPIVAASSLTARHWAVRLGMLFIDGGHSLDAALADYRGWSGWVAPGGVLAIHDVYPDAHAGGQAPYAVYRMALASGLFRELGRVESLALLGRL